jgi:5-methylthioadenosine/S-adenosylhomocysteine deaminase
MSILIKDVLLGGRRTNIYASGNIISEIGPKAGSKEGFVLNGEGKAAIPGLVNAHTHAAMTLMRGYADDLELHDWLSNHIWPLEAKLTEDDVYWGSKLACLEMIKSGTTCFNDMYWHPQGTARAVEEMGIRGVINAVFIDLFDKKKADEQITLNKKLFKDFKKYSNRVVFALGPHAVYTVSEESLQWAKEFADENSLLIHFHLAETRKENEDFVKKTGMRPIPYLEKIGFLCSNLVACHTVWVTKGEIKTLAKYGVKVVHTPTSNMKLATGGVMPYVEMKEAGLTVALGTDGCASNNNLDMFESMKFAALLQKAHRWDQTVLPAPEALAMATKEGAKALSLNAGEISVGKLADIALIDISRPELTPHYNLASDLVYSANGSCVSDVICDGKIVMQNRIVEGEYEIIAKARETARNLVSRSKLTYSALKGGYELTNSLKMSKRQTKRGGASE